MSRQIRTDCFSKAPKGPASFLHNGFKMCRRWKNQPKARVTTKNIKTTAYARNSRKDVETKTVVDYIEHVLRAEEASRSNSRNSAKHSPATSSSDSEVEELKQTIDSLQQSNKNLQQEMKRVIAGLSSLLKDAKQTSKPKSQQSPQSRRHLPSSALDPTNTISCVVQHPGALACTKASYHIDPLDQKCILTMQTTATATEGASELTLDDLEALAAQALLANASQTLRERTRAIQSNTPADDHARRIHAEICHVLLTGEVINAQRNSVVSPFGHESFIVTLKDLHNDRKIKAIFKPRIKGDADGWHRAPCEWLAYRLNLLLGMDRVPPCAYRTDVHLTVDGDTNLQYKEGAMMYFVDDASPLMESPKDCWNCSLDVLLSDTRILDVLLVNSDRHAGNFLLGRHWCQGSAETLMQSAASTQSAASGPNGSDDAGNYKHNGGGGGGGGNNTNSKKGNGAKNGRRESHYESDTTVHGSAIAFADPSRWKGEKGVILIDHAASLRYSADVTMQHENAFMTGPVRCVSAKTYLRLRFLDYATIASEFSGVMNEDEMRAMVKRRDSTLKYLDALVAERGYSNVVRE